MRRKLFKRNDQKNSPSKLALQLEKTKSENELRQDKIESCDGMDLSHVFTLQRVEAQESSKVIGSLNLNCSERRENDEVDTTQRDLEILAAELKINNQ